VRVWWRVVLYAVWAWSVLFSFALVGAWGRTCLDAASACAWDHPTLRAVSLVVAPALVMAGVGAGELLARRVMGSHPGRG
jgi:hypothetical protein